MTRGEERCRGLFWLWATGMSYRQIGEMIGVTRSRAWWLARWGASCIHSEEFWFRYDVEKLLQEGWLHP